VGDIETLNGLRPKLPSDLVEQGWFSNQVTIGYIKANQVDTFTETILPHMKPFPMGGLLALLEARPDLERKLVDLTNRISIESNNTMPQNMIWVHYMQNKRYDEAGQIFNANHQMKDNLQFSGLLKKVNQDMDTELGLRVLEVVKSTNLSPRSLAVVYSSNINALIDKNRSEEAEDLLLREVVSPMERSHSTTGARIEPVTISDINWTALNRLKQSIQQVYGRDVKFEVPQKQVTDDSPSSRPRHPSNSDHNETRAKASF
jgi:hypothetical protein